jgi:hypothetical protein
MAISLSIAGSLFFMKLLVYIRTKTKLTLSLDEDLIQFTHRHAHSTGKSISDHFSEFLTAHKVQSAHESAHKISTMLGLAKKLSNRR